MLYSWVLSDMNVAAMKNSQVRFDSQNAVSEDACSTASWDTGPHSIASG
jgi:hypothetical protein